MTTRSVDRSHPVLVEAYKVAWRDGGISAEYVRENLVWFMSPDEVGLFLESLEICDLEVPKDLWSDDED